MTKKLLLPYLYLIFSCEGNDPVPPPPPPPSPVIDTLWTRTIPTDKPNEKSFRVSIKPIIYKNQVIVSMHSLLGGEDEVLSAFDKTTGKLNWSWSDYISSANGEKALSFIDFTMTPFNDKLLYATFRANYLIDLINGTTLNVKTSTEDDESAGTGPAYFNDYLYQSIIKNEEGGYAKLISCNMSNLKLDEIFKIDYVNGFRPFLSGLNSFLNTSSELCIFGTINKLNFSARKEYGAVFVYNLGKRQFEWYYDSLFTKDASFNHTTVIYNNNAVVTVGDSIKCLNLSDGSVLWAIKIASQSFHNPFVIENNQLFISSGLGNVFCINMDNGAIIWENKANEPFIASAQNIEYHKNRIYLADTDLVVLDAMTGKFLHRIKSTIKLPRSFDPNIFNFTIDKTTDLIYFTEGYNLFCARLPK